MPLKTWATNDIPSAADFNNMFGDASTTDVTTQETTTSTTYTDLATAGPAVASLTMANGQQAWVMISARVKHSAAGGQSSFMSFAVSGATTISALDVNGAESDNNTTAGATVTRITAVTATGSGATTFTMKYKVVGGGTGTWNNRRIIVKKW